jgi:hypothetical protein
MQQKNFIFIYVHLSPIIASACDSIFWVRLCSCIRHFTNSIDELVASSVLTATVEACQYMHHGALRRQSPDHHLTLCLQLPRGLDPMRHKMVNKRTTINKIVLLFVFRNASQVALNMDCFLQRKKRVTN